MLYTNISDDRLAAAEFRALLASSSQGIIGVDRGGTIQLVNERAETLFGYGRGELLGQNIAALVPERVSGIHTEEVDEYFREPRPRPMGIGIDLKGRRSDGSEFPVEISLNPMQVGGETMILSLVADITERIQMEEHARRAHKMDAVGQLAGGVAHELNRFLAEISGHASTALAKSQGDAVLSSSLEAISKSADRAALLAQQLLAISGAQPAQLRWFDPNQRLSELRDTLASLLGKDIDLELVLGEDLGEILADPVQIDQVIVKLVENARDAMPDGGLVKIETAAVEAGESYAHFHLPVSPGPHIMLTVTDTGTGMTPEAQSHLFEPFFTTKAAGQGKGLGLAIVYGILRNAGGSIFTSSKPNHGTTFQVIIPRIGPTTD